MRAHFIAVLTAASITFVAAYPVQHQTPGYLDLPGTNIDDGLNGILGTDDASVSQTSTGSSGSANGGDVTNTATGTDGTITNEDGSSNGGIGGTSGSGTPSGDGLDSGRSGDASGGSVTNTGSSITNTGDSSEGGAGGTSSSPSTGSTVTEEPI